MLLKLSPMLRTPLPLWHKEQCMFTNDRAELSTYLTEDDLWCQVLRGPAKRPGSPLHPFRESKICYLGNGESTQLWVTDREHRDQSNIISAEKTNKPCLDVTLVVDEQVLRLQISVDEIQRVKVFKGQYNLGCVEAGVWFTAKHTRHVIYSQPVEGGNISSSPEVNSPESTDSP